MANINWHWQYNKSINADYLKAAFLLPARCIAGYFKRYIAKE
jgi:hypothetical protein